MKIKLLKDKNLHPEKYKKNEIVDIPDKIAKRWIDKKLAIEIKEVKTKNKKGK